MAKVTPEQYYQVAQKLCDASKSIETKLRGLDDGLDVGQSAGTYSTGGPAWASSFDQSASDVFEVGSTTAIAARELGYQVHQAGLNWAHAENESQGGGDQPTSAIPQGASLGTNLHPKSHVVGGTHEKPDHWDLVAEHVTTEWADCQEGKIGTAGTAFANFGRDRKTDAQTLWSDVTGVFPRDAQDQSPEVSGIVTEVGNVCQALNDTGDAATALGASCAEVHRVADIDKSTGRTSLTILNAILISYEIDKAATYALPYGKLLREQIDQMIEANKVAFARGMDALMNGINGTVETAAKSNTGIYALATGSTQLLSSILNRTPRQTNPVRNRDGTQNKRAGDEGERRAGIPEGAPKQEVTVTVDGRQVTVVPDQIDRINENVVEVKNTNEIRPYTDQIRAEAQYAKDQGYTMTLVVDHRTQINDPQIQQMIDSGQIQLVRKELDDNNDF
ncbi:MAG: putative toxin [Mycobacterium kyogaense]|uniref:putative toxin n=1 Tax=Mycobacterium kyogaense TaxID=2212479 RepID=UPI002FFB9343